MFDEKNNIEFLFRCPECSAPIEIKSGNYALHLNVDCVNCKHRFHVSLKLYDVGEQLKGCLANEVIKGEL